MSELAAQVFIFFLAGFETSSTTTQFALYELSKHQHYQDELRNEVKSVLKKYDGKVTYDAIMEMKFMDKVINETLRKYPPVPVLNRLCVKDYKIPDTNFTITKGMGVFIPILGIQNDEKYFSDPEKFDPSRFSEENKSTRHPYAHLPFGEGPRNCIGMRFGLLQTKVGLAVLLNSFKFTLSSATKEPIEMEKTSFILSPANTIYLNASSI